MQHGLVIGIGEVLWDMLPEGKQIGGAPCNFAYHVGQFGIDTCAVSAIGHDALGAEIIARLQKRGIGHRIEKVAYPTGTVNIELDSEGVPKYDIRESVAWDYIPFTDELERLAKRAKALCFGSLAQRSEASRTTINRLIDAIPAENDPLIVFDINLRQDFYDKETILNSLKRCNVLKINDEELEVVSSMLGLPTDEPEAACTTIVNNYGLRMLILTCGVKGSYVFTPEEVSYLPTPKVEVVDTVGAGDSFTASFIATLLHGKCVAEAHRRAVDVSAYVCSQHGAMPEMPDALTTFAS